MEWVLQVVDEVDDAFGLLRHQWLGVASEVGSLILAGTGIIAGIAGCALSAAPTLLSAALTANLAALLEIRSARRAARG